MTPGHDQDEPQRQSAFPLSQGHMLEIRAAVLEAGEAIMQVVREGDLGTNLKADESPVTRADLAADHILVARLENLTNDIGLVTEERVDSWADTPPARYFLIDPLDGTKEFVRGGSDFTVNVGLIEKGVPVAGFVYAPALERLFWTHWDLGAVEELAPFDPDRLGTLNRLRVAQDCSGRLDIVASKSHRDAQTDAFIASYKVGDLNCTGSSLKFCLVASGQAHLYPRMTPTMEWDTAAGDAVLRAAGGKMVCLDTSQPFPYGKAAYRNGSFVAAAPGVAVRPVK